MPQFAYKGRDSEGQLIEGVLEGATAGAVADVLLGRGLTPVEVRETERRAATKPSGPGSALFRPKVGHVDLLLFSRQMHTLLKAGVPIMRALAGLQESSTNPAMKEVIRDVRESLEAGRELSVALARHPRVFSSFYVSMVRVGETTGLLDEIFLRLFDHLDFERFMREQVRSALRYPMFVVLAMAVAIVVINLFVIPAFAKVFQGFGAELPLMTRMLIGFSDLMVAWWPGLLALGAGLVAVFRLWVATPKGRYDWEGIALRIPIAGKIVRKAALARFARSFALGTRSGVPLMMALTNSAQTVDNSYIARRIENMRDAVERGESVLRAAASVGIFTPVVLQMVAVGEESGAIDDMMEEIGQMYQREVEYELKTLGQQIEPVLIVALGVLVLILALGVFLPMWDLGRVAFGRK
jgi:MSHA biogenesis protein MshG